MKVIEDIWAKVLGGGIIAFFSTVFGVKIAQARTQTKLDSIEKTICDLKVSMGREICELKQEVHRIRDDFYKPRIDN